MRDGFGVGDSGQHPATAGCDPLQCSTRRRPRVGHLEADPGAVTALRGAETLEERQHRCDALVELASTHGTPASAAAARMAAAMTSAPRAITFGAPFERSYLMATAKWVGFVIRTSAWATSANMRLRDISWRI